MAQQGSDTIDFKPFFDMVVGILFILLILIAAQLFFSRFETDSPEAQAQQKRSARLAEQELFLNGVAGALKRAGFAAAADREGNRVTMPLTTLSAMPHGAANQGWLAPEPAVASRLANALSSVIACAGFDVTAPCARRFDVSLTHTAFSLTLGGLPLGVAPPPQAQILGMQWQAALFAPAPQFLQWNGSLGTALFVRQVAVAPSPGALEASMFAVEFVFAQ